MEVPRMRAVLDCALLWPLKSTFVHSFFPAEPSLIELRQMLASAFRDESFIRIQKAVREYVVRVNDCYDYRLLSQMKHQLDQLFSEKDEVKRSPTCCSLHERLHS